MKHKRFQLFILRNTASITIPAICVFLLLIFMIARYPVFDQIRCNKIEDVQNLSVRLDNLYKNGTRNIEYTASDLYYTGFDYHVNYKRKGSYYYTIQDNQLLIYLIKTKQPKIYIEKQEIKGRIIKDSVSAEYIIGQLATTNHMDAEMIRQSACVYIVSEPDYPYAFVTMIYLIFFLPIVLCILIFLYTLLVWVQPALHSQVRQLVVYGNPHSVIAEINKELAYHLLYHKNNIYITDSYMIITHLTKTEVIRLDDVKYLSKNIVEGTGFHKNKQIYRLTMSNPDKLFYEIDFTSEKVIDEVVFYIYGEKT